jgi:alkanesulfonate monooxygenase SsuD/methylene tetrahydromethanopterin reductase-like flavin-dependent oxidoreductase (luciferase family)
MTFTLLRRGQLIAVPPPEQALRFLEQEQRAGEGGGPRSERRAVVGSPQTVRAQLAEVVDSYGAEEAIVVCITYEHEARKRSYELLAQAFQLH